MFEIQSRDKITNILIVVGLSVYGAIPVLRSRITITDDSEDGDVTVTRLSSLAIGGLKTRS